MPTSTYISKPPYSTSCRNFTCAAGQQRCGDGCFDPTQSTCCTRPNNAHGLCAVVKSCYVEMCRAPGQICADKGPDLLQFSSAKENQTNSINVASQKSKAEAAPTQKKGGAGGAGHSGGVDMVEVRDWVEVAIERAVVVVLPSWQLDLVGSWETGRSACLLWERSLVG